MKKILVIALLVPLLVEAQNDVHKDFLMWYGARASTNITKKIEVGARLDLRTRNNATSVYRYFGGLFAEYQPVDFYKVAVNYRYSDWGFTNTHRIDIDNFAQHQIEREAFDVRLRLQRAFGLNTNLEDRVRIRARYQHIWSKRFRAFASAEYFYSKRYNFNNWDQARYTVGTKFRVALGHFITLFVRFENRFNVEYPQHRYMGGVYYNFKW